MTRQEVSNFIALELSVPVNQVAKIINSFEKTLDFITESTVDDVIPEWTNALTFQTDGSDAGKYCTHPDANGKKRIFETQTDDNINHEPPTDPNVTSNAYWEEISQSSGSAIKEWAAGIYGTGLVIVYHDHSAFGKGLYLLIDPVRPFASANIETEIDADKWVCITYNSPIKEVATGGANITLDFNHARECSFKCDVPIAGNKNILITNDEIAQEVKVWRIDVDAAGRELTFEADVKKQDWDGNWISALVWKSPGAGSYDLLAHRVNDVWTVRIYGIF